MSSVKRYTPYEYTGQGVLAVEEIPNGKYVLASDYDALKADCRERERAAFVAAYRLGVSHGVTGHKAVMNPMEQHVFFDAQYATLTGEEEK